MRISARIREMSKKIRERDKSSEVFTSKHKSNEYHYNYHDATHEDNLIIQEDMLNPIYLAASNSAGNIYYHQAINSLDARAFQKAIIKEVDAHIEPN